MIRVLVLLVNAAWGIGPDMMNKIIGKLTGPDTIAMMAQQMQPGVEDVIFGGAQGKVTMYSRKTQAPMIWVKLRKAPPIVVDREFYNISTVLGMYDQKNITDAISKPAPRRKKTPAPPMQLLVPPSFIDLKVDPEMIQNGLYVSQPLRQPAQEYINVAAVEDVRTIQGVADYMRKKREIKRLNKKFNRVMRQLITD